MGNILIVAGHPHPEFSVANKKIISLLLEEYPQARQDDLIKLYPDFNIAVKQEQAKLQWADTVVIQTPLFWYSLLSLVMRWIEEVFEHGWAYGSKGQALQGKRVILGVTAGSANEECEEGGETGISRSEIFRPCQLAFEFCGMNFCGYVFTGRIFNTGHSTEEERLTIHSRAHSHAASLMEMIDG